METVLFATGAPVRHEDQSYIVRSTEFEQPLEDDLLRILQGEKDVTIVGPRQVGKSSMAGWLVSNLQRKGFASAYLDLSSLHNDSLTEAEWLDALCEKLVDTLGRNLSREFTDPPPQLTLGFKRYIGQIMRYLDQNALVICFDEANAIPDALLDRFYSNIRAIINERLLADPVAIQNIRFIFAGVFNPHKLIKEKKNSPFNTTHVIRLRDFNRNESERLLKLLENNHRNVRVTDEVVKRVMYWTDGHPYLTQLFASYLDKALAHTRRSLDVSLVDSLSIKVEDAASTNLEYIRDRTLAFLSTERRRKFLENLLRGETRTFTRTTIITTFELIGTLKRSPENKCQVRNRMIAAILRDELDIPQPDPPQVVGQGFELLLEDLHSAILNSFSSSDLRTLVRLALKKDIDIISPPANNLATRVLDVLEYANRQGQVQMFMDESVKHNPTNQELKKIHEKCQHLLEN